MPLVQEGNRTVIARHEEKVIREWQDRLQRHWGDNQKLLLFQNAVEGRHDAFRFLLSQCNSKADIEASTIISRTIERVQSEQFNIADLFCEIKILHEVIDYLQHSETNTSSCDNGNNATVRRILDDFFETIALETSVIYEFIAERGTQALLFLDDHGHITYANRSARELLGDSVHRYDHFMTALAPVEESRLDKILQNLKNNPSLSPYSMTLKISNTHGENRDLGIEIALLDNASLHSVFYVCVTPSKVLGIEDHILEGFDHGVVRIDTHKQIYYANSAARQIIGINGNYENLPPTHVHEYFSDKIDKKKIDEELQKRKAGKLSRYEVNLKRSSGHRIPVSVFAIPEMNSMGNYVGSIAFMRNLEVEHAQQDFNKILLDSKSWKESLEGLCHWLFDKVEADAISVFRYTKDLQYSSIVASLENGGQEFKIERRWFHLSEGLIEWNKEPGFRFCPDFPKFLDQDFAQYLQNDDAIKKMQEVQGINSFMATPIMDDGINQAGVAFLSTQLDKFSPEDAELVKSLPLQEFVLSSLQRKDREEKAFQFQLMATLSDCDSFEDIALKVTEELAAHYKWDNVSIFDVTEELGKVVLMVQSQGSDKGYVLPENFDQSINVGLLGRAVRDKRDVYAPDVTLNPDFNREHDLTQSELVMPIFSSMYEPRRVFWLLNIEDSFSGFLVDHEIEELKEIVKHIEFIVNRMIDRVTFKHAMQYTSDGVIVTDARGTIRFANPESYRMLEYHQYGELIGRKIATLFCDAQMASNFQDGVFEDNHKVELLRGTDKPPISVLLSKIELPRHISDKYYVFKTLEPQKILANLDAIEKLVGITAHQAKTPLSLVHGMLHRLSHSEKAFNQNSIDAFVERSRSLLKKAELSYDRVAYSETIVSSHKKIETYIYLDLLFNEISQEIAGDTDDAIDLKVCGELKPISGDRHQIRFVCESLISHLLRNLAPNEKIIVDMDSETDCVDVRIHTRTCKQESSASEYDFTDWDRVVSDATFGQTAIRQIVENHAGSYDEPDIDTEFGNLSFKLSFPIADLSREH